MKDPRYFTGFVQRDGENWSGFVYGAPGPVLKPTLEELYQELSNGVQVMAPLYDEPLVLSLTIAPPGVAGEWAGSKWVPKG